MTFLRRTAEPSVCWRLAGEWTFTLATVNVKGMFAETSSPGVTILIDADGGTPRTVVDVARSEA